MDNNNQTFNIVITGTNHGDLSLYPTTRFLDAFYFRSVAFEEGTFTYPTTTFGGILANSNYFPDPIAPILLYDGSSLIQGITATGVLNERNSYLVNIISTDEYFYVYYESVNNRWELDYGTNLGGTDTLWASQVTTAEYPWLAGTFERVIGSASPEIITITKEGLPSPDPTFATEVSGGPISNYSYLDYSSLKSQINIGNFFCNPTLVLYFSAYEESVSVISKIIYDYKHNVGVLTPSISSVKTPITSLTTIEIAPGEFFQKEITNIVNLFLYTSPKNQIITINPIPSFNYITADTIYLSVIKFDNTVNEFELNFNIVHCGILDIYSESNILNSQVLNSTDTILLTMEDKKTKRVYNSMLRTDIPFYLLTGGDVVELAEDETEPDAIFEFESSDPGRDVFLAGEIRQKTLPAAPTPPPKINPITPPDFGEYFYRGEKGIRIRPLLARLLPRQEFFYEIPYSGLILLSGGAPYYPGTGISFNLEYRVI